MAAPLAALVSLYPVICTVSALINPAAASPLCPFIPLTSALAGRPRVDGPPESCAATCQIEMRFVFRLKQNKVALKINVFLRQRRPRMALPLTTKWECGAGEDVTCTHSPEDNLGLLVCLMRGSLNCGRKLRYLGRTHADSGGKNVQIQARSVPPLIESATVCQGANVFGVGKPHRVRRYHSRFQSGLALACTPAGIGCSATTP